jgi:hypothetical protein
MRAQRIAAVLVLSLLGALCAASCVQGPEATPETDENDEAAIGEAKEPAGLLSIIRCPRREHGIPCMQRCAEAGISCASGLRHPKKPEAGDGDLFQCRAALGGQSCWYYYESVEEICIFFRRAVGWMPPLCRYQGGEP